MSPKSQTSSVLAGAVGDCCVQGVKHTGTPVGKIIDVAGVQTYLSEPPALTQQSAGPKRMILLLQDYHAFQGFYVLGIDHLFGGPIYLHLDEPGWDRQAWLAKSRKQAEGTVPKWIDEAQKRYGTDAKYSTVGYCFGAPYVLELGATGRVVTAAFAHPSGLTEDHFKKLQAPIVLSTAEVDVAFPAASRRRAVDIVIEKKAAFHVQLFSGVSHGFGTKADPTVENSRWAKEESAQSIIDPFIRFSSL